MGGRLKGKFHLKIRADVCMARTPAYMGYSMQAINTINNESWPIWSQTTMGEGEWAN